MKTTRQIPDTVKARVLKMLSQQVRKRFTQEEDNRTMNTLENTLDQANDS